MLMHKGSARNWLAVAALVALVALLGHYHVHEQASGFCHLSHSSESGENQITHICSACEVLKYLAHQPGLIFDPTPEFETISHLRDAREAIHNPPRARTHDPRGPPIV